MADLQIAIPLLRLVVALKMERVEYEPEQFPAPDDAGTILPFSSMSP